MLRQELHASALAQAQQQQHLPTACGQSSLIKAGVASSEEESIQKHHELRQLAQEAESKPICGAAQPGEGKLRRGPALQLYWQRNNGCHQAGMVRICLGVCCSSTGRFVVAPLQPACSTLVLYKSFGAENRDSALTVVD